jgi:hypothetical protein
MPRREYTYPSGMGWTSYNLIETIGGYITAIGLVMVAANLITSLFRGVPAGNDPFEGDTLEWSTTSPPPAYNFALLPKISSPYAMWDKEDRERDAQRLAEGRLTLERGHETVATTTLDAELDEILGMPSSSPWPPLLAAALSGVFVMLLLGHLVTAAVFIVATLAVLAAWHWQEPEDDAPIIAGAREAS